MKKLLLSLLFLLMCTTVFAWNPPLGIKDEGGTEAKPVFTLDCVGSGIACTHSGKEATITVEAGGAETNSLETTVTGIADTEFFIGNGADSGTFVAISGDMTVSNAGTASIAAGVVVDADVSSDAVFAIRDVQIHAIGYTTDASTGDGIAYFDVPAELNGMNLILPRLAFVTAGSTGGTSMQVYNVTDSQDMLSTVVSVDSGELTSDTAATAGVVDTSHDDVVTNDQLRIDCDAVSTGTAPKGFMATLRFQKP